MTRGLPGSGKSTLLREAGLEDFTLASDDFRLRLAGPALGPSGLFGIPQDLNVQAWTQLIEALDARMGHGETLAVDAVHPSGADFQPYTRLAAKHRYRVACLDLTGMPFETALARNLSRPEWRRVSRHGMERFAGIMAAAEFPAGVLRIPVSCDGSHQRALRDFLAVPTIDLTGASRVVHVGDLQGSATAARELVRRLGGIRADDRWFFVGDAVDRGVENGDVMRWLLDDVMPRPNVTFMWGNHEDHLHREALGLEPVSAEFAERTLPQLREAGVTREDLGAFCDRLEDMVLYRRGDARVMVTHAGLSTVPHTPWMVSSRQCSHGTGRYADPVDEQFDRHAPEGWVQVHGHRNPGALPVQASPRSFNLEASVEFGGQLRAAVLDDGGWHVHEIANRVFAPFSTRRHRKMTIVPPWMAREGEGGTFMSAEIRAAMKAHPEVNERAASAAMPHVVSLNFGKKTFYDRSFDEITVKARGMFIDRDSGEIVARSYDKFFNVNERPDHALAALRERLRFPVTFWLKENGFLGLIGYDRRSDGLFVSSKSKAEGPFADMARQILFDAIPSAGKRDALRRFLRDCEASIPMEVIDPVRDPHIIEYPAPEVVFLDVVRRSTEFERLPHDGLVRLGKEFGVRTKQRSYTIRDWRAFEGWHERNSVDMSRKIEGYVCEDASGFQFKWKSPHYSFWKLVRGMKDFIVGEREGATRKAKPLDAQFLATRGLGFTADQAAELFEWCRAQDTAVLKSNVIELRKLFEAREAVAPPGPAR